jgi:hypothetical protein
MSTPKTNEEKATWIAFQLQKSEGAIRVLESAKKGAVSAYDERIRELTKFRTVLWGSCDEQGQLELFDVDAVLSDKIKGLIRAPLVGL